jgi:hypothetical protein
MKLFRNKYRENIELKITQLRDELTKIRAEKVSIKYQHTDQLKYCHLVNAEADTLIKIRLVESLLN